MEDLNLEEFKDLKLDLKEKVFKVKERRLVLNDKGNWVPAKDIIDDIGIIEKDS